MGKRAGVELGGRRLAECTGLPAPQCVCVPQFQGRHSAVGSAEAFGDSWNYFFYLCIYYYF